MADKLDKTTRGILGDINPEPGTRDHLRGSDGITDDENDDRAGSRDVSEGGGVATEIVDMTSVPWGVVTLTESCVKSLPREQPATRACYDDMVERIRADLRPFCAKHGIGGAIARGEVQMIGASGTVTTVSAHHLGLKRYNRTLVDGSRIGRESILRICDQLSVMSVVELTDLPCIGNDRADLALAGGAILEAVCRQWHAPMVRVADRGLREGVLMDLMRQADREADPFCRPGA